MADSRVGQTSCLLLLALTALSIHGAQTPPASRSHFERAPCPIDVAQDEKIDCGLLVVPENRAKINSRTIRLPVMIFRSRAVSPAADPLLFMAGGPGGSTVAGRRSGKQIPFLDERDYILLEQRGARYAQPALACPGINTLTGEISAGRLRDTAARAALVKAAAECRASLISAGADLDGYTSDASADDIDDLRQALGYAQWNLQGLSYSTRLMLTVLRKHPAGVRSVVLDSVLPPEVNFDEVSAANLLRALDVVFDGCAIDRRCSAAYPDLRQRFASLVASADRRPLRLPADPAATDVRVVDIRGAQVVDAIYAALHDVQMIPLIPRIIGSAAAGDADELLTLVKGNQGPSSFTWGLRLSVWCAEEMPFEDPVRIASQTSAALGLGGIDEGAAFPELCRAWNVAAAAPVENEPVKSDVPVLIFAGEFDPDTPPVWGRQLLDAMPNAVYVEMRGRSHGAGFNACGGQLVTAFLRSPRAPLPVECAQRIRGADFGASAAPKRLGKPLGS